MLIICSDGFLHPPAPIMQQKTQLPFRVEELYMLLI